MVGKVIEVVEIDSYIASSVLRVRNRDEMKKYEEAQQDCFILEFDPDDDDDDVVVDLDFSNKNDDSDLLFLAHKGKVACRDFPHPRHLCAIFPFKTTPQDSHCNQCYCYVCDLPAPCKMWVGHYNHCLALDNERWNTIRKLMREASKLPKLEGCMPHRRHECVKFPFKTTNDKSHCELCHCYVCEIPAPCEKWDGNGMVSHHQAFNNKLWRIQRTLMRKARNFQNKKVSYATIRVHVRQTDKLVVLVNAFKKQNKQFLSLSFILFSHSLSKVSNKDPFNAADLSVALNAGFKADLVNALKNKLQDLAGKHSDVLESLPPVVRKRVDVLREIQTEHDMLEGQFLEERAALEAKYQKLYQPRYRKRYEIVNGVVEVGGRTTEGEPIEEKGVPDFWLTAMKNNEMLLEEITERDEAALKFLKDIKWSRLDNSKGFKLEFYFDTNSFFKNCVLTKTYHMIDEDEPVMEKAIGTEIEWLRGKSLTQTIPKKKPKKGSKNAKPVTKTEQCESFFNFFSPTQVPEDVDDLYEEAVEELQTLMEQDYDIGSTIRDKIIPHAVSWFTGEAAEDEFGEDEEDDEEDEDEDEDDEDSDEEEEEMQTKKKTYAARKKGGKVPPAGDVQQGERPPECKQQ